MMFRKYICLFALVLLSLHVHAQEEWVDTTDYSYPDHIDWSGLTNIIDEDEDLESVFEEEDNILLIAYNPGCGHCLDFIDSTKIFYDSLSEYKFLFTLVDHPEILNQFQYLSASKNLAAYDRFYFAKAGNPFFAKLWIQHIPAIYYYGSGEDHEFVKFIDPKNQSFDYILSQLKTEEKE